ncbi:putative ABC transport system permease protein [Catalinimonas alkaloidigena]|uniref:Putative ABC transport system permease protein n=1 Tax=Catalinimonas alkaloidigena TaxID=1075417 RepID=A0A1G8X3A8_9BACT|nr:ABC transporter permease [Catalinimonas alkaloidigena]SDJ84250.1 putative ABC transport system permease protein [Catalinimonas alkaloidigena]
MNLINLLKIAGKALSRNKFRAFLTMLGIIIGVASVIAMLAIGQGSKDSIQAQISQMGSNLIFVRPETNMESGVRMDRSALQTLTLNDVEALQEQGTLLSGVSPEVSGSGQAIYSSKNWPTSIKGVNLAYLDIRKLELADGILFTDEDIRTAAKVAVIGQTVVDNLFDGADPIGQTIRFESIPFKVIGVLAEKGENTFGQDQDDIILAPYTTVQKRVLAITYIQSIYASAQREDVAEEASTQITEILRASHRLKESDPDDFTVRSQQELISTFSSTSEIMTVLLAAIAGISLLVGGIGIMNIMYVSVTERTREIGLRMAVGGRGTDILLQFLIEAILISVAGGLLGAALGVGSTFLISYYAGWPTTITQDSIVLSFAVCAVTGIFFGWYPARKAAALDPIVALRYE